MSEKFRSGTWAGAAQNFESYYRPDSEMCRICWLPAKNLCASDFHKSRKKGKVCESFQADHIPCAYCIALFGKISCIEQSIKCALTSCSNLFHQFFSIL